MPSRELAQQLHDRATRGEKLSAAEREQLETWYAEQDRLEADQLCKPGELPPVPVLRTQLNDALLQLHAVAREIGELTSENEVLRQEIARLQAKLTGDTKTQPA
jgi:hypothetical protein